VAATNQVAPGTRRSHSLGEPEETAPEPKLGCAAVRLQAAEAARGLLWGLCGGTLIRYALSAPGGAPPVKAISLERLANRDVGARARPEGKIVSVTIAGRAGDLLLRATASW
jgi:hypothetical protein